MDNEKADAFYERLELQLAESAAWPTEYLYKFIIPTEKHSIDAIHKIFDNKGAVIQSKKSKQGNYTSISVTVYCKNPEEVIRYYKEAGNVKGVISL